MKNHVQLRAKVHGISTVSILMTETLKLHYINDLYYNPTLFRFHSFQ
jgi:hypothetical protein